MPCNISFSSYRWPREMWETDNLQVINAYVSGAAIGKLFHITEDKISAFSVMSSTD